MFSSIDEGCKNCLIRFYGFTAERLRFLFICYYLELGPPLEIYTTTQQLSTSTITTTTTSTTTTSTTTSTTSTRSSSPTVLRTQQPSRSPEFPLWTWWSPVTETVTTDGGDDDQDIQEGEKTWEGDAVNLVISNAVTKSVTESVTESVTGPYYSKENSRRDNREGGSGENYLGLAGPAASQSESQTDDDDHQTIQQKYEEMVAHNTRLIDILRSTLEMQAELFRRMIRYLFP